MRRLLCLLMALCLFIPAALADHLTLQTADTVEEMLRAIGAEYLILERDIADEDAVQDIYAQANAAFGRVDILVNNAATDDENGFDTIEKITQSVIDETFAVNVRGSILMMREFIRRRGDYGRIINISTDAAQVLAQARQRWKR